jgi:uncharacterized protein
MLNFDQNIGIIMKLVGRETQIERLDKVVNSDQSEFIVVYGRRRTGKTFLIREYFNYSFHFYSSGVDDERIDIQLANFTASLRQSPFYEEETTPTNWIEAFQQLRLILEKDNSPYKVVFIDELPWMDTSNSDLKAALETFWNMWASARKDIKLIVCGSAASWIINTFIDSEGGFYNRATEIIKLAPFSLQETKQFLQAKEIEYDDYQIISLYMSLGGIPFYLNKVEKGLSAFQNVDKLFFGNNSVIKDEYLLLFRSLFKKFKRHVSVIDVLAKKSKGLYRSEIVKALKITDGGSFSVVLSELEAADFISTYNLPNTTKKNPIYKISDQYILFYKNFVEKHHKTSNYWINNINTPQWYSWAGRAFELTCYNHVDKIKQALGIDGIQSDTYVWSNKNAQIDLIIDRKDRVINLFEIKFSDKEYAMTKEYEKELRNKQSEYQQEYPSTKSLWFILLTTFGLKSKTNASIFQKVIDMNKLF